MHRIKMSENKGLQMDFAESLREKRISLFVCFVRRALMMLAFNIHLCLLF